jgi:single-strand DNA-binding protein
MAGELTIFGEGRLGNDAEIRVTPTGKNVTSFSVAVTPRVLSDSGGYVDKETLWLRCFVWGKNATGAANELRKGMLITFNGTLEQNSYTNKEGVEVKTLEVNIKGYGIVPKNVAEPVTASVETNRSVEDPIEDPWA